ncbi:MAG: Wzt carbohydrate-binding domain-containing protein, partial [Phycisphaerae bacterium]
RIGSLLEVGTGFHVELTGRENVFLNGAILGMKAAEIRRRFDEIVDFSGIERFIDTPVKRYSSGMYTRLAFAVAAHLDPDILIVDEVLSVGDHAFQNKCRMKMNSVVREGRTILFVSHQLGSIVDLCTRTIWLQEGRVVMSGESDKVVASYLSQRAGNGIADLSQRERTAIDGTTPLMSSVRTLDDQGRPSDVLEHGKMMTVQIGVGGDVTGEVVVGVGVTDAGGHRVLHLCNRDDKTPLSIGDDTRCIDVSFMNILNKGDYFVTLWIGDGYLHSLDYATNCLRFRVDTDASRGQLLCKGAVVLTGQWRTSRD